MEELREFLSAARIAFAPASPDRILRQLRQQGALDYVVVNRAASLYLITRVNLK
jgi:hypothetical protein